MQAVDESRPNDGGSGSFLSPGKAFALLAGVIVVIGAVLFVTRPDAAPAPPNAPANNTAAAPPTFELTNAEALARFEHLDQLRSQMYESRDASLRTTFLTSTSPLREVAADEVRQLINDNVTVEMNFQTRRLEILSNGGDTIVVRQVVREAPTFTAEEGGDVTHSKPQLNVIDWTLLFDGDSWKIHASETVRTRILKR